MDKSIQIRQQHADRLISLLLLALCAYLFSLIRDFSFYGSVFPHYINIVLSILSVVYFIKSWIIPLRKRSTEQEAPCRLVDDYPSFVIVFPLTLVYVFFLLNFLGFLTSSIVFSASMILAIKIIRKERNAQKLLLYFFFAGAFSFAVFYVFRYLLLIRLPTGMFI